MMLVRLPGYVSMELDRAALTLPRSVELFDAISKSPSYKLLALQRSDADGKIHELLIVELASDGVPTRNRIGIQYPEPLGIEVSSDELSIPRVYPLRRDFPSVPHRSSPLPGFPPDLCMYFEPVRSILRSWTPAKFLKRIEWWLQTTATESLHAADQPVERLFFSTIYELVLPFDFDQRRKAGEPFSIGRAVQRPEDHGITLFGAFLGEADTGAKRGNPSDLLEASVPPMVHGVVEETPQSLGVLHDMLLPKGLNLRDTLAEQIHARVGSGTPSSESTKFTTLLLTVPILRQTGGEIESYEQKAFLLAKPALQIGELLGCIVKLDGKYYRDVAIGGQKPAAEEWRNLELDAVEVLFQNDRAAARRQSGISDEGPRGTVIGVGALGSAIYDLWTRAGWGSWTVVDKDHIKPHNIVRHTAVFDQVGMSKTDAALALATLVAVGGNQIDGLVADALAAPTPVLDKALTEAQLIVDVTTTLDYPRKASITPHWGRHASVFITPTGRDCVLLLEDSNRKTTLISLEAQYYRAVLGCDWGRIHLERNGSTYWSGAGCRDISLALPYSRVLTHAATLAEQLMLFCRQEQPTIRVWERNPNSGAVAAHEIPVAEETRHNLGDFTAYLDHGLRDKLQKLRAAALPNETGGVVLGYWDYNVKALVLVDALPAPEDSHSDESSFVRGTQGLFGAVEEVSRRTGGVVGYVGEWHSHPPGVEAKPSADDLTQLAALALQMAEDGLPVASIIVGEDHTRVMLGQRA